MLLAGRNILEENSVPHPGTLVENGVQTEGVQHPGTNACAVHVIPVGDTVSVVAPVADDINAKNICNRRNMVCKSARRKLFLIFID